MGARKIMNQKGTMKNPQSRLEKDELLRLSVYTDGVIIAKDDKDPAVEDSVVALATAIGTYVAYADLDVKKSLVDLIRSYKMGYDFAKKSKTGKIVNVLVNDKTGEVVDVETKKKKDIFNREDYK